MDELIKIISIKKLNKIGMYELTLEKEKLEVSDDIIVEFKLEKDKEITLDELKKIKKENDKRNIFFKVCNYISYGMRSEYEINKYLKEHNVSASDAKAIIKELKEIDLVDDNKLAFYILDNVMQNKKGPKVFYNKLFERKLNVNKDDYVYSEDKEEEIVDLVITKLYDKKKSLPVKKQKEQLYQKLLRDGFSSSLIEHKINKIDFIDESKETLDKEIIKLNKKYDKLPNDEKKDKMIRNLIQKGYDYHDIIKVIK